MMSTVTYKRFADLAMTSGVHAACELADSHHVPGAVIARWLARLAPTGRG